MAQYPTQADLLSYPLPRRWVDEHFLRSDPFAFGNSGGFRKIVNLISDELDVDPNGIFCVGSGAVGLSLHPLKIEGSSLKRFDANSDLDMAVISSFHFEQAWRDLREAAHPEIDQMHDLVARHISQQRKRIFDGAIIANKLLPALSFGSYWIPALARVSQEIAIICNRDVEVNFWIYRDYWSLRTYVLNGIKRCREAVA